MIKPLVFADEQIKHNKPVVGALEFPTTPIVVPSKKSQIVPKAVFESEEHIPCETVAGVIAVMKQYNEDLYLNHKKYCDSQIPLLYPISVKKVVDWADRHIQQIPQVVTPCVTVQQYINTTNFMEDVANIVKQLKPTFFSKFRKSNETIQQMVTRLQAIKLAYGTQLPICDVGQQQSNKLYSKLMLKQLIITSVHQTLGSRVDTYIDAAMHSKKLVLQQGITQLMMTERQFADLSKLMTAQIAQVDQLINITIPATGSAMSLNSKGDTFFTN